MKTILSHGKYYSTLKQNFRNKRVKDKIVISLQQSIINYIYYYCEKPTPYVFLLNTLYLHSIVLGNCIIDILHL
jgi:hypothetical protein